MDSFNKVISFVLGLVVVIVFLAIISGKINLKKINITKSASITPTVTPRPTIKKEEAATYNQYNSQVPKNTTPKSIPATGSPTVLLPVLFSTLASGLYLRRKK